MLAVSSNSGQISLQLAPKKTPVLSSRYSASSVRPPGLNSKMRLRGLRQLAFEARGGGFYLREITTMRLSESAAAESDSACRNRRPGA